MTLLLGHSPTFKLLSGPIVLSPEPETVTTLQESSWLHEQPPILTSLSTSHSTESVTMPNLKSVPSMLDVTTFQSFSVTISELRNVPSVTNLTMSDPGQPHTAPPFMHL